MTDYPDADLPRTDPTLHVSPSAWRNICQNWGLGAAGEGAWWRLVTLGAIHGRPLRDDAGRTWGVCISPGTPQLVAMTADPGGKAGLDELLARSLATQEEPEGDLMVSLPTPYAVSVPSLGTGALDRTAGG